MTDIDWTKPIQTLDGRKARVICTDYIDADYSIVCLVMEKGNEVLYTITKDGSYDVNTKKNSHSDIVNVPEKRTFKIPLNDDSFIYCGDN